MNEPGPSQYLRPDELAYVGEQPQVRGVIRECPEDFRVDEALGFDLEGDGQHAWLQIEKRNLTTEQLAGRLARALECPRNRVSYAGLKDRNAVTRQWFSVDLAGSPEPQWSSVLVDDCRLISSTRHRRKLRRGAHSANRFTLMIRHLDGATDTIDDALERIVRVGMPNYFGPQRFGSDGSNVEAARRMLAGESKVRDRHRRGLYLSTARSLLFNRVLSMRVSLGNWCVPVAGDVMMLDGTHSVFPAPVVDQTLERRADAQDIHPTGPLWGRGENPAEGDALGLERRALESCEQWCDGLERAGATRDRRPLRVPVRDLRWKWCGERELQLQFRLPPGSFATSVLRQVVIA